MCSNGHLAYKWCSQPVLNRKMHSGDLMFASALLLSGNNYTKISQFASFLKLPILKPATFHKIQRTYLVPCINNYWIDVQEEILAEYRNRDVVLLGMLS